MSEEWRSEFYQRAQTHLAYVILAGFYIVAGVVLTVHAIAPDLLLLDQGVMFAHPIANTVTGVTWVTGGAGVLIGILRPERYVSRSWSIERGGWVNLTIGWTIYTASTFIVAPYALLSVLIGMANVGVGLARLSEIAAGERRAHQQTRTAREIERIAREVVEDTV